MVAEIELDTDEDVDITVRGDNREEIEDALQALMNIAPPTSQGSGMGAGGPMSMLDIDEDEEYELDDEFFDEMMEMLFPGHSDLAELPFSPFPTPEEMNEMMSDLADEPVGPAAGGTESSSDEESDGESDDEDPTSINVQ